MIIYNDFYTVEKLSEKVGVEVRTLRETISSGELKASKVFGRYYITHNDFLEFLSKHQYEPTKEGKKKRTMK